MWLQSGKFSIGNSRSVQCLRQGEREVDFSVPFALFAYLCQYSSATGSNPVSLIFVMSCITFVEAP